MIGNRSFSGKAASIVRVEVSQLVIWTGNIGVGGGLGSVELEDWPLRAHDEEEEGA